MIVPVYNGAQTLERCLAALGAQTLARSEYEVIVVDDGSSDATRDIASRFPVRVLTQPHCGAAAARNLGAQNSQGEILLFTDADTEPARDWAEAMLAAFKNRNVAGARGIYRTRQRELVARFSQLEYEFKYTRTRRERTIDFVDTYSAGYCRDLFLAQGGFDESFLSAEDQEFSFRIAKQGYDLVFVPDAVVYHAHRASLWAYLRRKFWIGYWKVRVHRMHPDKALKDSHTPGTQKLQVALFLVLLATLGAVPVVPYAWLAALAALLGIEVSGSDLLAFALRRDGAAALVTPGIIFLRAAAIALGVIAGVGGEVARSACIKRAMDIVGAGAGLALALPLMLVIAAAIKLDSPGPVFFIQSRCGKDGKPFRMYKFRSMVVNAETMLDEVMARNPLQGPAFKIPDDPRVTRVGRVLRRYCLDELPQFVNVLKGEMSLVGPRPEETRIVAQYTESQRRRLAVKPGMAGPMEMSRRGSLPLDERVRLEVRYIENYSVCEDVRLLVQTFIAIIIGRRSY